MARYDRQDAAAQSLGIGARRRDGRIGTEGLARLGNVLWWTGNAFATLLIVVAVIVAFAVERDGVAMAIFTVISAVIVHLIGRAARYILTDAPS